MKKITLVLLVALAANAAQAKIWRINNDATKDPDFTTIQAANDNSFTLSGDTLHVEPSSNPYAGVNFTKTLVIIGNGYFLSGVGANAGLQQNVNTTTISGDCNFFSSANGTGAPNTGAGQSITSRMMGITVTGTIRLRNVSNILVTRCRIVSIVFENYGITAGAAGNAVNVRFTKCFINGSVNTSGFTGTGTLDVTFENNIFSGVTGSGSFQILLPTTVKGLFRNNILNEGGGFTIGLSNFYVTNNIFVANASMTNTNVNNVYKNNIFTLANAGNGITNGVDGNVTGANVANIFATNPNTGTGDARFQILNTATNPANNGGETIGAVVTPNCGAFGATDPYRLSGIPAVPTIYSLTIPGGVATGATSMQISVSTRSNN